MKYKRLKTESNNLDAIGLMNRDLTERALKMRCVSYMSNVKLKLLTATIFEVNASRENLKKINKNISRQSVIINNQKAELEENNKRLRENEKILERKVRLRTEKLNNSNRQLQSEIQIKNRIEKTLIKTVRNLKVLSKYNQLLVKVENEQILLNETCRIVVDIGGYVLCRVGFARYENNSKQVFPVARHGMVEGHQEGISTRMDSARDGTGPTSRAIRSGSISIIKNIMSDPDCRPWSDLAKREGYASLIALPLFMDENIFGALTIYSSYTDAFDNSEVALLKELAENLSFGIDMLRTRKKKKEAEASLQQALNELSKLKNRIQKENRYLQEEIKDDFNFENIISSSEIFQKVLLKVKQVAGTNSTVLILGESGTGKELIARAVHNISNRSGRALVKVNCSALSASLIESELFGHEKGAFTGALARKAGRFELADNGTIFLDEIGDFPIELQTKLLRVLQEKEFERLGGTKTIKVDIRVIAATNRNLEQMIKDGQFRDDLYYRLNIFPIYIPPLREHKEDIQLLINHFLKKHTAKTGKKIMAVSKGIIDSFNHYDWPGNIRELENVIERATILCDGPILTDDTIHNMNVSRLEHTEQTDMPTKPMSIKDNESLLINSALKYSNWVIEGKNGAARILNVPPSTLRFKIKKHNIKKPK